MALSKMDKLRFPSSGTRSEDPDAWKERAIHVLNQKLKERPESVKALKQAMDNPDLPSECVVIPKTQDGRIQIFSWKRPAHFIACKLWRWPDLQDNSELRGIPSCKFPFITDMKKRKETTELCINPFHYERPTLDVPRTIRTSEPPANGASGITGLGYSAPSLPTTEPPQVWGKIVYYEFASRVGEAYQCQSNEVDVDGYTNPDRNSSRFSLGSLSNPQRQPLSQKTLMHIGKGIHLIRTNDGIFIQNKMAGGALFLHSHYINYEENLAAAKVLKLPSNRTLKIFDFKLFENLLHGRNSEGYAAVYELKKFCSVRMSFVKGWGPGYQRLDIMNTPCWMDLHFCRAFQMLDSVLKEMGGPDSQLSSFS